MKINSRFLLINYELLENFCKTKRPYFHKNNKLTFYILYENENFYQIAANDENDKYNLGSLGFIKDIMRWYTENELHAQKDGCTDIFINNFITYCKLNKVIKSDE